jgi:hypothetical protein
LHARLSPAVTVSSTLKRSSTSFRFGEYRIKTDTFSVPLLASKSGDGVKMNAQAIAGISQQKTLHPLLFYN